MMINRPYALTSSRRHVRGQSIVRDKAIALYALVICEHVRLAHFWQIILRVILLTPKARALWYYDIICIRSILSSLSAPSLVYLYFLSTRILEYPPHHYNHIIIFFIIITTRAIHPIFFFKYGIIVIPFFGPFAATPLILAYSSRCSWPLAHQTEHRIEDSSLYSYMPSSSF